MNHETLTLGIPPQFFLLRILHMTITLPEQPRTLVDIPVVYIFVCTESIIHMIQ